jgi:hypothetical protein
LGGRERGERLVELGNRDAGGDGERTVIAAQRGNEVRRSGARAPMPPARSVREPLDSRANVERLRSRRRVVEK